MTLSIEPQTVQEGERVVFTCLATANPEILGYRCEEQGLGALWEGAGEGSATGCGERAPSPNPPVLPPSPDGPREASRLKMPMRVAMRRMSIIPSSRSLCPVRFSTKWAAPMSAL